MNNGVEWRSGEPAGSRRSAVRILVLTMVSVVTMVLAGCAAQMAFREGKTLVSDGKPLEGLGKLEEASKLDPASAEYRMAYLQTRDRYAQSLIERAETARSEGRYDEAERAYRETLLVRAQQDRAVSGLRLLDQQRRWDGVLKEAEQAIARKDWDGARNKLTLVLTERPQQPTAVKLMQHIEQQTARPVAEPALTAAYKQPITIEFKDVPLRTVFEVISRTSRLNFLFDKEVKTDQRTSIYLRNSTVEAAVNWLLLTNQLEQRVLDGSSVLIYPATAAKQREYQPLTVKSFYLANAEAKNVANTLKTVLKTKDVVVDDKLNLVILRDSPEAIRLAEKLVALHDVPEAEVMLEVEVLEITRGRLMDLGVRWPDQVALSLLPSTTGGNLTLEDLRNPTRSMVGVAVGAATVYAKKQDSDANILANPRIRARNHEKAKILIGQRVPNITTTSTATGFVAESVNYLDVGLKLEVEPNIYLDNEVAIKISLEVSSIVSQQQTKSGSLAYTLGTRSAQTVLRLKDGENQVLAGLINDEDRRAANKVPGLGEIPILGRLFGDQSNDSTKTEIVLSITPRVLRNVQRPDAKTMEFESGTDASLRAWPTDAGAAQGASIFTTPTAVDVAGAMGSSMVGATASSANATAAITGAGIVSTAAAAPVSMVTTNEGVVAGQTLMAWEGATQAGLGDMFAVQLTLQSEQPVVSIPLAVSFDPKVLQVVTVSEGAYLKDGGAQTTFSQRVDPSGQVLIAASRSNKATGATSPGVVALLGFRVLPTATATSTQLQVLSVAPVAVSGQNVSVPPPAPHRLTLVR